MSHTEQLWTAVSHNLHMPLTELELTLKQQTRGWQLESLVMLNVELYSLLEENPREITLARSLLTIPGEEIGNVYITYS